MIYVTENQQNPAISDMHLGSRRDVTPDHRTASDYGIRADRCELSVSDHTNLEFGQCNSSNIFYYEDSIFAPEANKM